MIVNIEKDPENLEVEDFLIEDIKNAIELAGKIYDLNAEISVTITNDKKIHELNLQYRNIDRPTDVLSFALRESDEPEIIFDDDQPEILGDIVISIDRAKDQAVEYNHSLRREVTFLTVHGILHLLGYDHIDEADRLEMEAEQKFLMDKLGISREV